MNRVPFSSRGVLSAFRASKVSSFLCAAGLAWMALGQAAHASPIKGSISSVGTLANDRFGSSLDRNGNTVVIGAWAGGDDSEGAAYVSERSVGGWSAPTQLVAPLNSGDDFGWSVAVDQTHIIVGMRSASEPDSLDEPLAETGAVVFFTKSGGQWQAIQQIFSSERDEGAGFGYSVDLLGDTAIAGEPGADNVVTDTFEIGAAYIMKRGSNGQWQERQRLTAPSPRAGDVFGANVALSQVGSRTFAFASAVGRDDRGNASGAVYVFERSSASGQFSYLQTLVAPDGAAGDQFGYSMSAREGHLAIGAAGVDLPGKQDAGAVYVYALSGSSWVQRGKLTGGGRQSRDLFGNRVALSETGLAVGRDPDITNEGAAEVVSVYEREPGGSYRLKGNVYAPQGEGQASFGSAMSFEGEELLVGMDQGVGVSGRKGGLVAVFDTGSIPAPLGGPLSLAGLGLGFVALRRSRR